MLNLPRQVESYYIYPVQNIAIYLLLNKLTFRPHSGPRFIRAISTESIVQNN